MAGNYVDNAIAFRTAIVFVSIDLKYKNKLNQ